MRIRKSNSSGFTLIELLIVIIIIGILAAIAFVAYSSAQNKAKKSDVQSTISQMKEKLGEYNASKGYYPLTKADFAAWLQTADGGNNKNFASKITDFNADGTNDDTVKYAPDPSTCNNTDTFCTGYTITGDATYWGGSSTDDITATN